MFVVRLLLFSVLLYNTEARIADYPSPTTTRETPPNTEISVPVDDTTSANRSEIIDWYYGSFYEKNKTRANETVPVKNPPAVIYKKPANSTSKLYEGDVGYLTVDNGILAAHVPEKTDKRENSSKKISWPYFKRFSKTDDETYWYDRFENDTMTRTVTPYYRHNTIVVDSDTTTTWRPYNSTSFLRDENNESTTTTPHYYGYNITTRTRPRYTTIKPRNWYDKNGTIPYGYYVSTTSDTKYDITISNVSTTSDTKYDIPTSNYSTTSDTKYDIPTSNVSTTSDTKYDITPTDVNYNRVTPVSKIANRINSSKAPTSCCNPVNISNNSSSNANEAGYYGGFTDFLKKMVGTIVPSGSIKARNSTVTNLAVANGYGNLFFYIYN